jgi:hypothetical protein
VAGRSRRQRNYSRATAITFIMVAQSVSKPDKTLNEREGRYVAFLGWLPDSPSLQVLKSAPEFQVILSERKKQNAGKRSQIIAIENSYQ